MTISGRNLSRHCCLEVKAEAPISMVAGSDEVGVALVWPSSNVRAQSVCGDFVNVTVLTLVKFYEILHGAHES